MQQLDKWQRELEKLTQKEFKKTDSKLFNVYRQSLIDIKKKLYNYTQAYPQLSFSSRLEVERLFHVAEEITNILTATSTSVEDSIKGFSTNQAEQGYYGVWYALEQSQKITLGMPLINHELVQQMVNKPVEGKRLSTRLYQHRDDLAKNVTNNIVEGLFVGDSYAKIAKRVSDQTEASYRQALRIAITESGRTNSEASQLSSERAQSLGIDMEKRWLSTLDGKTRADHRALDGQQVPIDGEFKINGHSAKQPRMFGVAKEDIHCRCTSINIVNGIAPELRKDNETGEMVEYKNYDEWYQNKINAYLLHDQSPRITKKTNTNTYSVNRQLVNSKEYHDKFDSLPFNKRPRERLYKNSMGILEHRDGTQFEDIVIIDYKSGNIIASNTESKNKYSVGISKEQYEKVLATKNGTTILHNHPEGGRPSIADIMSAFKTESVKSSVVVGHDGSLHVIFDLDKTFDIEAYYNKCYNDYVSQGIPKTLAKIKATDKIYEKGVFKYEKS